MLKKCYIKEGVYSGHSYYKNLPWGDDWYFDKFGRYPELGDIIIYSEFDEDTEKYKLKFGIILYYNSHKSSSKRTITVFYFAPLKNKACREDYERVVGDYGTTGLAAFSPFIDLSYIRTNDNIVLLDRFLFSAVSPHML